MSEFFTLVQAIGDLFAFGAATAELATAVIKRIGHGSRAEAAPDERTGR